MFFSDTVFIVIITVIFLILGTIISYFIVYDSAKTKAGGMRAAIATILITCLLVGLFDYFYYQTVTERSTITIYENNYEEGFQTYHAKGPVTLKDHVVSFKDLSGKKHTIYGETISIEKS